MPQTRCKQIDYKSMNARLPFYNQHMIQQLLRQKSFLFNVTKIHSLHLKIGKTNIILWKELKEGNFIENNKYLLNKGEIRFWCDCYRGNIVFSSTNYIKNFKEFFRPHLMSENGTWSHIQRFTTNPRISETLQVVKLYTHIIHICT